MRNLVKMLLVVLMVWWQLLEVLVWQCSQDAGQGAVALGQGAILRDLVKVLLVVLKVQCQLLALLVWQCSHISDQSAVVDADGHCLPYDHDAFMIVRALSIIGMNRRAQ